MVKSLNNQEEIQIGIIVYIVTMSDHNLIDQMQQEKDIVFQPKTRNLGCHIKILHRSFRNKLLSLTKKMIPRRIITSIILLTTNLKTFMKLRQTMNTINLKIALKEMNKNVSSKIMDPIFRLLIIFLKRKLNN